MSSNDSSPTSLPFNYVIVVWGNKYVDMLLNVALPCLLAPGNLPGLSNLPESQFLFITSPDDRSRIEKSRIFLNLKSVIRTEFMEPAWINDSTPYWLKAARGHQVAAKLAAQNAGYCIYLAPDFLLSNGALRCLVDLAASGKSAVLVPGIRVVTETVVPELLNSYSRDDGDPVAIEPRALVRLCLKHVHPENQRYNWGHPQFSHCPVVCTWNVPGEDGLLVRAFHLHPLLVKMNNVESAQLLDSNTIDGEFLALNCPNWDAIHVETDSDNIALFSLTEELDRFQPGTMNVASIEQFRKLAYSDVVNPLHRYYFTKAIKLHSGELNDRWTSLEHQSAHVAYRILAMPDHSEAMRYISARLMLWEVIRRIARKIVRDTAYVFRVLRKQASALSRQPDKLEKATGERDSQRQ